MRLREEDIVVIESMYIGKDRSIDWHIGEIYSCYGKEYLVIIGLVRGKPNKIKAVMADALQLHKIGRL